MPTPRTLARLDALAWGLIYGGLLAIGLGIAVGRRQAELGWTLDTGGSAAVLAGAVLIVVRSRFKGKP